VVFGWIFLADNFFVCVFVVIKKGLFLTGFVLLITLGFWQISRAHEKTEILAHFDQNRQLLPLHFSEIPQDIQSLQFRPVQLTGYFLNDKLVFIDKQNDKGQLGVEVLTPFVPVDAPNRFILIDRGWLNITDRNKLPRLPAIEGEWTIEGYLSSFPTKSVVLGTTQTDTFPLRLTMFNTPLIEAAFGDKLIPYMILLKPDQRFGFTRDWQPVVMMPSKHIAYAVQWFLLAFIWLGVFILLHFKRFKKGER
jgi:surfeit locus 1 family protein